LTATVLVDFVRELIDYAGLFPPASLDMATAVANYARYRNGPEREMLGRFVVPVRRLEEFEAAADGRLPRALGASRWQLSALPSTEWREDLERILAFNAAHHDDEQGLAEVSAVELKPTRPAEIGVMGSTYPRAWVLYYEVPIEDDPRPWLEAIAAAEGRAKVRTGGVTPDAIPSVTEVARFLTGCAELGVAFKATAGLHHPLRGEHALTYEPAAPRCVMHGFLNVFVGAALRHANAVDLDDLRAILEEQELGAFACEGDGIRWRGLHLDREALVEARRSFAHSFGSCSFEEPVEALQAAELL
jgi:hypothetical protein